MAKWLVAAAIVVVGVAVLAGKDDIRRFREMKRL
jgi:hypothetical protein